MYPKFIPVKKMTPPQLGFGQWLQALSYALSQPREIAIADEPDSTDTQALASVVPDGYQLLLDFAVFCLTDLLAAMS